MPISFIQNVYKFLRYFEFPFSNHKQRHGFIFTIFAMFISISFYLNNAELDKIKHYNIFYFPSFRFNNVGLMLKNYFAFKLEINFFE